ncbi:MAG: TIGR00282 family metallophosphoesterase [Oscillospiraceae bacterium]|nr:TIGR00282 family metallophosphoesterase [Oscillospiraceae bacterium]
MNLLFIGDVVGENGCRFLQKKLPGIKRELGIDITVINGENSANGNGITRDSADMLFRAGADVITTGNHAFQRRNDLDLFGNECIVRPANYSDACPGKGYTILDMGASRAAVVNLQGVLFMEPLANPFDTMDALLPEIDTPVIFVDFHAEATSEKKAMGHYLAGRVTAVLGTHTHVQTADACILGGHTGYITDAGMTGAEESVLGLETQAAVDRLHLHVPVRAAESENPCMLNGVVIEYDKKCGKCTKITPLIMR